MYNQPLKTIYLPFGVIHYLNDYYASEQTRELLHKAKLSCNKSLHIISNQIKPFLVKNNIIPVPSSSGRASKNMKILSLSNLAIQDIIVGANRPKLYNLKKKNLHPGKQYFQFELLAKPTTTDNLILFDTVVATGNTYNHCLKALNKSTPIYCYAVDIDQLKTSNPILFILPYFKIGSAD